MSTYSQANQPIRVDTVLEEDVLLLESFSGEEAVSAPFVFTLDLLSEDPDLDGDEILRSEMRIDVGLAEGEVRPIHGLVRRFLQVGWDQDLIHYRVELVPWIWFLSLRRDSRIFQEMDVLAIVEEVFGEAGYSDFDIRCTRSYDEREFTVQYRESDLDFVSRLLEDEGIFYFFEHTESKHTLVLADDVSAFSPCEGQPEARVYADAVPDEDVVTEFVREHSVHSGQVTLSDYDYLQPSMTLRSTVAGDEPEEIYDYPGHFDDLDAGDLRARVALERQEARRQMVRGAGTCRAFVSGTRFDLLDHVWRDANQTWALLKVRHHARNASYRAEARGEGYDYRNEFVAIPHSVPYRPPRRTAKPVVKGAQTAEVVGPSGEKIWVDKHGRVKVHFHWDRLGSRDDDSSCWVRVSQNWAGKQWGGMFIPHIGQEVIVDFLEGDPDRPIITGRVYNAENPPPQELPANQHKSIIEDDFGNEMVFDATPGDEHIRIRSPSHASSMELGKSFRLSTISDWISHVKGDSGYISEGAKVGGQIGFKGSVDLAGSISIFAGFKLDLEISEKIGLSAGPTFKWSKGQEYSAGAAPWTKHHSKRIILNSDEEIFLIGGDGDQSVVDGDAKALTLQYGENPAAQQVKPNVLTKVAVVAGALSGITGSILATRAWQGLDKKGETKQVHYGILGGGGLLGTLLPAAASLKERLSSVEVEKDFGTLHSPVHATVKLNDEGILLESGKANVEVKKDGNVNLTSGENSNVVSKGRSVHAVADETVVLKGKRVLAVDGQFKTKNLLDSG